MVKNLLLWFYIECRLIRAVKVVSAAIMIDVLTDDALVEDVLAMCITIIITIIIVTTIPSFCMDPTVTGFAVHSTGETTLDSLLPIISHIDHRHYYKALQFLDLYRDPI